MVDTFELVEAKQSQLFTQANTQRVERQKEAPIFVVSGNPAYNMGQVNENDRNKNRDRAESGIWHLFFASSAAALSDSAVKAFEV